MHNITTILWCQKNSLRSKQKVIFKFHCFQKLDINYYKRSMFQMTWNSKLKLPRYIKGHPWKKLEAKPFFAWKFAHLQFSLFPKFGDQLLKRRMFQMTWNSKLKLPGYIKGHPQKKMEAKPLFCTKICIFAIFIVFKNMRSITTWYQTLFYSNKMLL